MKKWGINLREIFSDRDAQLSWKRTISALAFLCMVIAFSANTFFKFQVDPIIFDGFLYIVCVGILGVASEKFAKK